MKKKKNKKVLIIVAIIVAAAIAIVAIGGVTLMGQSEVQEIVSLQEIQERDLSQFVSLQGTVTNANKTNYTSCAAAEVTEVNVQVGDEVKAGDVLVTMDPASIQEQIDSAQSSLSNSQGMQALTNSQNQHALNSAVTDQNTQLTQAGNAINDANAAVTAKQNEINTATTSLETKKADLADEPKDIIQLNLELSDIKTQYDMLPADDPNRPTLTEVADKEREVQRVQTLIDDINTLENVTIPGLQAELTAAQTAVTDANSNYTSVQNATDESVYAAQSSINAAAFSGDDSTLVNQIADLNKQLEACTVVAAADGIVTKVNVSVGDINAPNSVLVTVENDEQVLMEASVSEKDILKLEEGMEAVVTSDALDDVEIAGTVIRVVRVAESAGSLPTGDDMGSVPSGNNGFSVQIALEPCDLLSGMTAKAQITIEGNPNVLCVPYDLVQEDENGKNYVLVAVPNDDGTYTAERRDITIGETYDYYVEVKGGDVVAGDMIIMDYAIMEGDTFTGDGGDMTFYDENGEVMEVE